MLNTFMTLVQCPSWDCKSASCLPFVSLTVSTCSLTDIFAFLALCRHLRELWRLGLLTGYTSQDGHGDRCKLHRPLPKVLTLPALII